MERVFSKQAFILGEEVAGLEEEVATHCDSRFAIGCASGTDALILALMALDIGPGDEVITTPFTFFATASSIVRVGATPVFVDIDPVTRNLDLDRVEAAITPRTKAIVPVHYAGLAVDMPRLLDIAARHGLKVVEDAAHAQGGVVEFLMGLIPDTILGALARGDILPVIFISILVGIVIARMNPGMSSCLIVTHPSARSILRKTPRPLRIVTGAAARRADADACATGLGLGAEDVTLPMVGRARVILGEVERGARE